MDGGGSSLDPAYAVLHGDGPAGAAEQAHVSAAVSQRIRDEWIREQLRARRLEFTREHELAVFVGTWNVNGKKPGGEGLETWLGAHGSSRLPDLYVLGFQEVVDLTAGNVVLDNASKERSQLWVETLAMTLSRMHGGRRYQLLHERHMVGVMLCVFLLDQHVAHTPRASIQSTQTPCGVLGLGNKGGVAVRVQVYETTFCFVCGHLAAHREEVEQRNADFASVMQRSQFRDEPLALAQRSSEERLAAPQDASLMVPEGVSLYRRAYEAATELSSPGGGGPGSVSVAPAPDAPDGVGAQTGLSLQPLVALASFGIVEHDYVFWLGDFNYRISAEHSTEAVFDRVMAGDLAWLRANDQLLIEQSSGRCFAGFKEAEIQFLPTYKFQAGTNAYDRRPEKKVRAPAYCDRVLWRDSVNESHARILKYVSVPSLCSSDHKPVVALFEARVKERLPRERSRVFQEVIRALDRFENDERPQMQVDRNALPFAGGLCYMERREERLVLTNAGKVPVAWRFVPKLEDHAISKGWLRPEPTFGLLTPGQHCEVTVAALVDAHTARRVASGAENLEDILVLRLENGRDHFIVASAHLVPTCFGQDLHRLVRAHAPFAAAPEEREHALAERVARFGPDKAKAPLKLPKELWWLCNFLWVYDLLKVPGILVASPRLAQPAKLAAVRRCVDHGFEIVPEDKGAAMAHAVATVILELLAALPEPVVPLSLFPRADMDTMAMDAWARRFLEQLPPLSHNVFVYVVTFLREVVKNVSFNKVQPRDLARLFAHVLMRPTEALECQKEGASSSGIPFDLPNWFPGQEKRDAGLVALAEKVIMHFLQPDRAFAL